MIVFDKGRSARQPCMACGGLYYEPASGKEGVENFQPLRDLDSPQDITFAAEFIETLLTLQGLKVTPPIGKAVLDAVNLLRDMPVGRRTITTFAQQVNYSDPDTRRSVVQENLTPYIWEGDALPLQ